MHNSFAVIANGKTTVTPKLYTTTVQISDYTLPDLKFLLVPSLPVDIILGMDVLSTFKFSVNISTAECFLEGRLISKPMTPVETTAEVHTAEEHLLELTESQKQELEAFLKEELKKFEDLYGTTDLIEHKIKLKPGTEPIKQRYRPLIPKM